MSDDFHICDDDQRDVQGQTLQLLDFVGIGLQTIASVTVAIGQGFGMLSNEFYRAALLRRARQEERRQRREAGYELERMVNGGGSDG